MKQIQPLRTMVQRLLLLVLGISVLSVAKAQTAAPLSLKEALQYALKNKADAVKATLDEENSQHKIDDAKSQALPHVSANGSLTYNPVLQLTALPGDLAGQPGKTLLIPMGQKWNSGASLSLSQ